MTKVIFATCNKMPDLTASDRLAAAALEERSCSVIAGAWNGPREVFADADLIVIRSTWDYPATPEAFTRWLAELSNYNAVVNPAALMQWNLSKRYLLTLAELGAPLPPTMPVAPSAEAIAAAMDDLSLSRAVVKPELGATGSGLSIVERDDANGLCDAAEKLAMPGIIQPLIPEISFQGETSMMFIDGLFTHAVVKRPKAGTILCQEEHGGVTERADPPGWAIDEAAWILSMVPEVSIYARVDVVILDEKIWLMEVELIEPELFFTYCPEAADRFAVVLLERVN